MGKLFDRSAHCDGKEAYATRGLAHRVASRRNRMGKNLTVYRCQFCGQWHMGFKPRSRRPRAEEPSWQPAQ